MSLLHLYRAPGLSATRRVALLEKAKDQISTDIRGLETEHCLNIDTSSELTPAERDALGWLLRETFEPDRFGATSFLGTNGEVLEVGPRMNFSTAWSTNAVSICRACGLDKISRIERSRRYLLETSTPLTDEQKAVFLATVHDRMTECPYPEPLTSFDPGIEPEKTIEIPVLEEGRAALERINREMGLAFDDWDLDYYTDLFVHRIGRNPTNVECFDIAQSNSEHSRHWFFKGKLVIDGQEAPAHLMELIREPLEANPNNSVIAFKDNSSAIRGYPIRTIVPAQPGEPSPFVMTELDHHVIFTAETHNFPSGVAPFPGAETGTGGRLRDVHAAGRGSHYVA
ncbi:MAG: phosphoribosylformylglycinamidine synthase, partial [Thermoanaerobaculia bacterium]